ncbi:hypothetical protein G4B88_007902 [Cannabis sativa]|uniref:Reverse transcriptase zinc-binding domain-containing protein n=1 Tax=Cannabis sativa TaxID=3483 RepID=A0A7J6DM13_CANSA|nr:hypothetical protein G4B88_007902 [Cannabis sativa]
MDESRGNSCLIIVDKSGVKDVFAEASGVNVPEESDNCDDSGEQAKKARLFLDSLRSVESSLEAIQEGDEERGLIHGRMKAHDLMPALVDIENDSFFVYGPPTRAARKDFWEERTMDVLALNHPWLLMGDLNTITGQQDKFGGREVEESDGSDLNDLLDATGGVDLGCVGNLFTWTNGRNFQDLIKERLDRALCDPEWMVSYPKAGVRALAIKDSDHAPLVLDLLLDRERFHTPFRYLDAWSRDEGCKAVIQQAWAIDVRGAELSQFLGFRKLGKEDRFLGNPIIWSNSKTKDLRYIKDKICSKIEGWRCKLLSQAGRSTLIRAVAQSTPVYSMATYLFPKTLCHEMDQAVRKFWWMGSESKDRFLALCDWNSLCLPLDRGGLNFKKFGDVNLALVAKLGWKLAKEEDSLWCKVFKAKYWGNREQAFWNSDLPRNASFGAKGIMATRDLIRNEACWVLADGGKADLWASPWIPWLDWDKSRAAFNPLCVPNPIKVSTLIGANGEWIASSVQRWFVPSVASSLHLIQRLPSSQDDLLVWKDATNGMFSPSVAYKSIIKSRWGETDQIWLRIWKLQLTERLKMFLWKLCRDIIPFGNRLQRIFGNSTRCVICGAAEDSALHLFFKCPLAKAVWFASRWAIRSDTLNFGAPRDMVVWLLSPEFLKGADAEVLGEFLRFGVCLFDALWTARNRAFHDQISPTWRGVLAKVTSAVAYLLSAWESPTTAGGLQHSPAALYTGNPVLLVDAGWDSGGYLGVHAVKWCTMRGWNRMVIASDCQLLVHGLHARRAPNWRLAGVFWQLVEMLDALPDVKIEWTPRAGVLAAHKLAKWAILHSVSGLFSAEDLVPLVAV